MNWADKLRGGPSAPSANSTANMPSLGEGTTASSGNRGKSYAAAAVAAGHATTQAQQHQNQQQNQQRSKAQQNQQLAQDNKQQELLQQAASAAAAAAASSSTQQQKESQQEQQQQQQKPNTFDFYIVLDFEATCSNESRIKNQEIIELPSVLVDAQRAVVVAEFQRFVKPLHNPQLTEFCTNLTGIPQRCVDEAKPFPAVFAEYRQWLASCGLNENSAETSGRFAFVTCGDWDLKTMLPIQLRNPRDRGAAAQVDWANCPKSSPTIFTRWINLKQVYQRVAGRAIHGMHDMASVNNVPMLGHHHSGIDDCRNIARLLIALLRKGMMVDLTFGSLTPEEQLVTRPGPSVYPKEFPSSLAPLSPEAKEALDRAQAASKLAQEREEAQKQQQQRGGSGPNAPPNSAAAAAATSDSAAPAKATSATSLPLGPPVDIDKTKDAVKLTLGDNVTAAQLVGQNNDFMQLSKRLSSCLRHNALQWGIPMSLNGFVKVKDLLRSNRFHQCTPQQLAAVVAQSDKQRFALGIGASDGELYIRANQAHSIQDLIVDMDRVTDAATVPIAVHGTRLAAWEAIRKQGLSRMARQHVHFASGLPGEDGVISGMRYGAEVLIYLDVAKALEAGMPLFRSSNGVILTPGFDGIVPPIFFKKVVDRRSGKELN